MLIRLETTLLLFVGLFRRGGRPLYEKKDSYPSSTRLGKEHVFKKTFFFQIQYNSFIYYPE